MTPTTRHSLRPTLAMALFLWVCLLISMLLHWHANGSFFDIPDPDAWLRLTIVRDLYEGKGWYHHLIDRDNAPFGLVTPWTRPLDLLLLAMAAPLAPWVGLTHALLTAATLLNVILGVSCVLLIAATLRLQGDHFPNDGLLIAMAFSLSPAISAYFHIGFADHHSLLTLLFLALIYALARAGSPSVHHGNIRAPGAFMAAGILAGLGIWVSVEFVAVAACVYAWFGLGWIRNGHAWMRNAWRFSLGALAVTMIGLLLERPPSTRFLVEYDTLSVLYVAALMLATLCCLALDRAAPALPSQTHRAAAACIFAALALALLVWCFPPLLQGPLADVTPEMRRLFLSQVSEMHSLPQLATRSPGFAISMALYSVLSISALPVAMRQGLCRTAFDGLLAILTVVFLALMAVHIRWMYYAVSVSILLGARLLAVLYRQCFRHQVSPSSWQRLLIALIALAVLPPVIQISAPRLSDPAIAPYERNRKHCETALLHIIQQGQLVESLGTNPLTIAAPPNTSTQMLFWTPHRIVASNYHRNSAGYTDQWRLYHAAGETEARAIIGQRDIRVIIACATDNPSIYSPWFLSVIQGETLLPWLMPLPALNDETVGLRAFRVIAPS